MRRALPTRQEAMRMLTEMTIPFKDGISFTQLELRLISDLAWAREDLKPAQPSRPVEAAPKQRGIDISNLRFYADMSRQHEWGTDVIHWGVIEQTLREIANRLSAVPAPLVPVIALPKSLGNVTRLYP
jgi:hypothetical protein